VGFDTDSFIRTRSAAAPREIDGGRRATPLRQLSARRFLAVFAAIALCFLGVTAYAQHLQGAIERAALDIADNAAPSIQHLAQTRTDLRHLQLVLSQRIADGAADRAALDAVVELRAHLRAEMDAYLTLPTVPGERDLWKGIGEDLLRVDAAVDRALILLAQGDVRGASAIRDGQLAAATERATDSMARALDLNTAHVRQLAHAINASRSRAAFVERALDAVSALLALVAGWLLLRAVRHYQAILVENRLLSEQRAEELEKFAGRVAHDILSPLSAASLALALLDREAEEGGRAKTNIARGQRNVMRVQRIVSGLFELARAGSQPLPGVRAEVGPIVEDVADEVRLEAAEVGIEVCVAPIPPCAVACNEGALTSLLSNLLRNAVKYMGDRPERRVAVTVHERPAAVRVEVADTGPGIPEHLRARIFEPYVRANGGDQPGLGLGLATVKRIAEAHGGAVGVSSAPGAGSVFWFELPKPAPRDEGRRNAEESEPAAVARAS
jgi:signal transduction histidine kinase